MQELRTSAHLILTPCATNSYWHGSRDTARPAGEGQQLSQQSSGQTSEQLLASSLESNNGRPAGKLAGLEETFSDPTFCDRGGKFHRSVPELRFFPI